LAFNYKYSTATLFIASLQKNWQMVSCLTNITTKAADYLKIRNKHTV